MDKYAVREAIPQNVEENLKAYPDLLRTLLFYRNIDTSDKAQEFLNPNYETGVHDPFLMKDMDKAVERVLRAIQNNEKILIYSDYDADGIPAAVVMHDFFKSIGYTNFDIYIPHRHNEGYGLHLEALEKFKEQNVHLLITLDCGIVDHEEVRHASDAGIDVIVTDHHMPGETLPEAYAVLNSKREDCEYPYDMLCGSGVAFKLVQGILAKNRFGLKEGAEKWLLDMVGLATLSDMVPLHNENRVFAHYGIKVIRKSRRPGLQKLLSIMKMKQEHISEDDIGFMITPRINAASRMGVPTDAFKMLSETDEVQAHILARHLDEINNERKVLVATLVKEIKKTMQEREEHYRTTKVIVLGNPKWRPSILGLAANSIAEEYNKPVFLWGREDGVHIKGSCRSDGVTNLVKIMEGARGALLDFGGHKMSGGFSVEHDKIHALEEALLQSTEALGNEAQEKEKIYIDSELSLDDITWKNSDFIERLSPFGVGNPKPLFLFKNIEIQEVKEFGKQKNHLELIFQNSKNKKIPAIGFFMLIEDFGSKLGKGKTINLVASIEKSTFKYNPELRLRIVDIL
jgi:single-stranded-DNA-specific exonuclease